MAYQFVIIDEDNWAPSWREQYRRIEKQVNDDLIRQRDIGLSDRNFSREAYDKIMDQIEDKYSIDKQKNGSIKNEEFGIEVCYSVDGDSQICFDTQHLVAKKQEYVNLINHIFLHRNDIEYEYDEPHEQSLELLDFEEFKNKIRNSKAYVRTNYIISKINQIDNYIKSLQLLGRPSKDDCITYTIIYDVLRQQLVLGNIDLQHFLNRNESKADIEIIIPYFIDEVQHIGTLIKYENIRDLSVRIKLQSVKPLEMTNLYQYQMMDLYSTEIVYTLFYNQPFCGYLPDKVSADYLVHRPDDQDEYMDVDISIDMTELQLKALSITDIADQINKQRATDKIIRQLEKSNKDVQATTKTLQIKATDLYDLIRLNGKEYKDREDWVKTYYDEIQEYLNLNKNPYQSLPCTLPCNFQVNDIKISNKTVQDAANLKGLLSYVGAKTVTISNDLDNFNEIDGSDEVYDLFGDKNVDGMLEDSRIDEVNAENMSDYEAEMMTREHRRSRAELRDKVNTYRKK